jgi:hypothetical protein
MSQRFHRKLTPKVPKVLLVPTSLLGRLLPPPDGVATPGTKLGAAVEVGESVPVTEDCVSIAASGQMTKDTPQFLP